MLSCTCTATKTCAGEDGTGATAWASAGVLARVRVDMMVLGVAHHR